VNKWRKTIGESGRCHARSKKDCWRSANKEWLELRRQYKREQRGKVAAAERVPCACESKKKKFALFLYKRTGSLVLKGQVVTLPGSWVSHQGRRYASQA